MNGGLKFVDLCLSDGLPCSRSIKGVGIGACVKNSRGKMIVCSRFSDVSLFEDWVSKKLIKWKWELKGSEGRED